MKQNNWRVTYTTVTPESAEQGDASEIGFVDAGGGLWPIDESDKLDVGMTLREALRVCRPNEDCGRWFSESEGETDYSSGEVTTKSLHPPAGISAASYSRVRRLLCA